MTETESMTQAGVPPGRRLEADTLAVSGLSQAEARRLFELFSEHYEAVAEAAFMRDLSAKDWIVVLRDTESRIQGFSTMSLQHHSIPPMGRIRILFSGDTVISPSYWGSQALPFALLNLAGRVCARSPDPLYWLLITKGHRTYRYLPAFSLEYWPRHDREMPEGIRLLRDNLGRACFGNTYDPERGILAYPESRGHLKPELAAIPVGDLARPEVAFFLAANPGYTRGEELVCLTRLDSRNLRPLPRRIFEAGLQSGPEDSVLSHV
jgi:hypothetical protein